MYIEFSGNSTHALGIASSTYYQARYKSTFIRAAKLWV